MRKPRVIGRAGRAARAGSGGLGPDAAHTILTITNNGSGTPLVTTGAPHGLVGDETVTVTGNSVAAYNGTPSLVGSVPTATTFTLGDLSYTEDGTGGTWSSA